MCVVFQMERCRLARLLWWWQSWGAATLPASVGLKCHFQLMAGPPVACRGLFGDVHGPPGSLGHLPSWQALCFCSLVHTRFENCILNSSPLKQKEFYIFVVLIWMHEIFETFSPLYIFHVNVQFRNWGRLPLFLKFKPSVGFYENLKHSFMFLVTFCVP